MEPEQNGQLPGSPSIFSTILSLSPRHHGQCTHSWPGKERHPDVAMYPSSQSCEAGEATGTPRSQLVWNGTDNNWQSRISKPSVFLRGQSSSHSAAVSSQSETLELGYRTTPSVIPQHPPCLPGEGPSGLPLRKIGFGGFTKVGPSFPPLLIKAGQLRLA